jgi:hypothetical protein
VSDDGDSKDSRPAGATTYTGRAGRPSKLTQEVADTVLTCIGHGASVGEAAAACDLDKDTIHEWNRRGRRDRAEGRDTPYARFSDRYENTRRAAAVPIISAVYGAALKGNINAARFWLSSRFPERWSQSAVTLRTGSAPVRVQVEATEEWLHKTVTTAKTIREAYDQADSVEKMAALVRYDTERRAAMRAELLTRQGNGAALDADEAE